MADIFISYSKPHRHLTEQLAKDLEAQGLSVWWDTELLAGESFRHRIQEELKSCRAAIVIWTPDSVASDYVLSEAERARLAKKLIQARTSDIDPHELPPPFDTSHVPLIDDRRSIYGGLARLGLLKDFKVDNATPTALYAASTSDNRSIWSLRSNGLLLALLAIMAATTAGFAVYRSYSVPKVASADDLRKRGAIAVETFYRSLSGGLNDTEVFASEMRLGRRGLMGKVEAVAELRKLDGKYGRVACKPDMSTLSVKKPDQAPDGFRAIITSFCDLTDKSGQTVTERFPLEIEVARNAGKDRITGLWQPEKMVLWQARER